MAKLDKIKQDNPELNITIIDVIQSIDPSSTNKYCEFLIKMIKGKDNTQRAIVDSLISGLFGVKSIESLHKFEEHSKANRIPQEFKDISRHNDWFFIEQGVKIADDVVKRKQLEKETKKLFENDEWVVLIPESYEASQLYAYNTKWCITQKNYWNDYKKSSRIIFVINKKNNEKYAISKRMNDSVIQGWDAKDKETSPLIWEFTDEIWKILRSELKKTKLDLDLEQLPEGTIYGSRGKVVPLNDASIRELESFYKSYSEVISSEFKEMIISRGKSLRDKENENKKTTPDIVKVSKLINDLSYKDKYYDYAKYDMDLSEILKTLNL
jgi:hypothetical protein